MKLLYKYPFRVSILSVIILFCTASGFAQTILNGDFENNTAGTDQINMSNANYSATMANSVAFGSYGDMDIIKSSTYCGLAEHGSWYVAFTAGGTDAISLTLSSPLVIGNSYTISFYDRSCVGTYSTGTAPFQFGLSTVNNVQGTVIYTSPSSPVTSVWTQRTFTFTAPNNGLYLTVQMTAGGLSDWGQLDNVEFVTSGRPAVSQFLSSDSTLCANDCISFTDLSTNNPTSWQWKFTGATPATSTDQNPPFVCYTNAGTFPVTLHASNGNGGDTLTLTDFITVSDVPPTPVITQNNDTLSFTPDSSYTGYQWYDSTTIIPGATDTFLVVASAGNYNVQVENATGCEVAVGINVILGMENVKDDGFAVYPDPARNQLTVSGLPFTTGQTTIRIYNVLGEDVHSELLQPSNYKLQTTLDVSSLSSGIYFLRLSSQNGTVTRKFIKE